MACSSRRQLLKLIVVLAITNLSLADAIPRAGPQAQAEYKLKRQFKQYEDKDNASRIALAKTLRVAARNLKEHPQADDDVAVRYVMLRDAREFAVDGGDFHLAFACIDQMAKDFPINPLDAKLSAIAAGLDKTNLPMPQLGEAYLHAVDDFLEVADPDSAHRTMLLVHNCQRQARFPPALSHRVTDYDRKVGDARRDLQNVAIAAQKLKKAPDDPALNETVGRYLCTVGRSDVGLPMLAKGNDAPLRALAVKDLTNPTEVGAILEVADAWWSGEDAKSLRLSAAHKRAAFWYEKALPLVSPDKKPAIEKRLAEMEE